MKDIELAKKLLAELKSLTSNDFELHRVEVLEKDLTEGLPVVEVIDDNHQKFNDVIYTRRDSGHFHNYSSAIHRAVYEYYCGKIPEGYHIHHKDFDKSNNQIQNLQKITSKEHRTLHANLQNFQERICCQCGAKFLTKSINNSTRFCSKKCESRAYKKAESTQEIRHCVICGQSFSTHKYNNTKTCSKKCKHLLAGKTKSKYEHKKICPICGKIFYNVKHPKTLCCSRSCGAKLRRQNKK